MPIEILTAGFFNNPVGYGSAALAQATGQPPPVTTAHTALAGLPAASAIAPVLFNYVPAGLAAASAFAAINLGPTLVYPGQPAAQGKALIPGITPQLVHPGPGISSGAGLPATTTSSSGGAGSLVILSPQTLPGVNYNQAYPGITLYATGGTPPYTWSVVSGAMPAGFTLSSSGVLTGGTLTSGAATYSFTVQCNDSASHVVTQACTSTVTNETLQTSNGSSNTQMSPFTYYGVPESSIMPGNMAVVFDMFESGWNPPAGSSGTVVKTQVLNCYDPGNWWVTTQTTSGSGETPVDTGAVYTGPEARQVWYYDAYGYQAEPPLSYFQSITASYSHIAPQPNGIAWNTEGAQLFEFNFDLWLNTFATEIMIWTHTQGARYPWGSAPATHNTGYGLASSYPVANNNPVSITFPNNYEPYLGELVTIPCGPGGTNVTYGFSYNIEAVPMTYNSTTTYLGPRGPFNFIQVNPAGTAFNNTSSGFVNLWNATTGNGLLNWLMNNGFIGGTCSAGVPAGTAVGSGGTYTPTFNSSNYGVEICSTGGTTYPALTFQFTSHTLLTDKTWAGGGTPP